MPPYVALSFSAFQPPAKPNAQKPSAPKHLSHIPAARHPSISNRYTERLETPVTQTKQTTRTNSNRYKTRLFHNTISILDVAGGPAPDTTRQRLLIGNQIIRTGGNSKKTNDGTHL